MVPSDDNCLIIAGCVTRPSETRYSPAGLPIVRFVLEHHSRQIEAGIPRQARCRIVVLACGKRLAEAAGQLAPGSLIKVRGFISRANHRRGEARLILHAQCIEPLDIPE